MTVIPSGSPVQETPSVPAPPSVASPAPSTETETVCSRGQIHPEAQRLSERYSVSYEEVINWFCLGFGFGEIDQAYALAQLNSVPVEQIFALRIAGMGWGEIRQMFDTTPQASNLGAGQGNKPDK